MTAPTVYRSKTEAVVDWTTTTKKDKQEAVRKSSAEVRNVVPSCIVNFGPGAKHAISYFRAGELDNRPTIVLSVDSMK